VYLVFQNHGLVDTYIRIDDVSVTGGALGAILSIQWLMDTADPSTPNVNDERWATVETFSIAGTTPVADHSDVGGAWFRIGIEAGNYVDGNVQIIMSKDRVA
jgi:hypothetical protein